MKASTAFTALIFATYATTAFAGEFELIRKVKQPVGPDTYVVRTPDGKKVAIMPSRVSPKTRLEVKRRNAIFASSEDIERNFAAAEWFTGCKVNRDLSAMSKTRDGATIDVVMDCK